MRFEWTDEKIEQYIRASKYTEFHKNLAARIHPFLNESDRILDIGCGTGCIDIALSPWVKSITAFDIDDRAIDYFKEEIKKSDMHNITAYTRDFSQMSTIDCDVALLCYFGATHDELLEIIHAARRQTIVVMHSAGATTKPSKISRKVKHTSATQMHQFLSAMDLDYDFVDTRLEFGQPLRSKEEAIHFFEGYLQHFTHEERAQKIQVQLEELEKIDDKQYPYFYSRMKDISIFIIRGSASE
ncbi:MAG: class I SAM-dependent methyltransferase [Clostridiales Family XIII bacterium]|jgi:predicted RNA methylase|nr:class I SAM-dependent methyltransferase [Clostridiales Family XIII bacterium]